MGNVRRIEDIPEDVWTLIFSYFQRPEDLLHASLTCKALHRASKVKSLWRNFPVRTIIDIESMQKFCEEFKQLHKSIGIKIIITYGYFSTDKLGIKHKFGACFAKFKQLKYLKIVSLSNKGHSIMYHLPESLDQLDVPNMRYRYLFKYGKCKLKILNIGDNSFTGNYRIFPADVTHFSMTKKEFNTNDFLYFFLATKICKINSLELICGGNFRRLCYNIIREWREYRIDYLQSFTIDFCKSNGSRQKYNFDLCSNEFEKIETNPL